MATDIENIVSILDKIDAQSLGHDAGAVLRLTEAAKKLVARIESPFMHIFYTTTAPAQVTAALHVISDVGLWEAWRDAGGKEATLVDLRDMCHVPCDTALLRRLLILLVANDMVLDVGEDRWKPTAATLALGDKDSTAYNCLMTAVTHIGPSAQNLPNYLARKGYKEPSDPSDTNYMDLTPERLSIFDRMAADQQMSKFFSGFMQGFADYKLDWTEIFDTTELLDGFDSGKQDSTLLVDIGGSHGLDVTRLLARRPGLPAGSLVLQDLPAVVANTKVDEKITLMPHDFFQPQPIVGSRAYFLRAVLHDWDDNDALRILKQITAVMKKGYSKLLVCDINLPPKGAQRLQTLSDFTMLHLCSSWDRPEHKWIGLFQRAGLKVVKVWNHPVSADSVFETELAG